MQALLRAKPSRYSGSGQGCQAAPVDAVRRPTTFRFSRAYSISRRVADPMQPPSLDTRTSSARSIRLSCSSPRASRREVHRLFADVLGPSPITPCASVAHESPVGGRKALLRHFTVIGDEMGGRVTPMFSGAGLWIETTIEPQMPREAARLHPHKQAALDRHLGILMFKLRPLPVMES